MSPTARHPHTLCRKSRFAAACAAGTAGPWELILEWGEGGGSFDILWYSSMFLFSGCLRLRIRKHRVVRAFAVGYSRWGNVCEHNRYRMPPRPRQKGTKFRVIQ